jgi:NADPH-dependent glutamate synthase beta subunit-like oxidoreductase
MEACPANFDIRGMMEHVREGDYRAAADIVHNFYCFSSSFNRICPAFCQEDCVAAKKGDSIQI